MYMLIFLCQGRFPWSKDLPVTKAERYIRIMENKMSTPPEILCNGLPGNLFT